MLTGSENCARTPPAALQVEPDPRAPASSSTTSRTPARASAWAELRPVMPPPMTTTEAEDGGGRRGAVITVITVLSGNGNGRRVRCDHAALRRAAPSTVRRPRRLAFLHGRRPRPGHAAHPGRGPGDRQHDGGRGGPRLHDRRGVPAD